MPDNSEVITLEIDERPALQSTGKANAALDAYEKRAATAGEGVSRSFESTGERIIRVSDRSRASVERLVASAEKRASFAGKSDTERLIAEREQLVKRLGGDEAAVGRVTKAFQTLLDSQHKTVSVSERTAAAIRSPLDTAKEAASSFVSKLGSVGLIGSAIAASAVLAAKAIFDIGAASGKAAEQTVNLADRLDLTVSQTQKLKAVADIAGVDIGVLEGSTRLLAAALEDTTGAGEKTSLAFRKMGIATVTAKGDQREMGVVLLDLLNKLSQIPNSAERVKRANETLGRGAKEIIPLIKNYAQLREVVERIGVGNNPALVESFAKLDDQIDVIEKRWGKLKKSFEAAVVLPILERTLPFLDRVLQVLASTGGKVDIRAGESAIHGNEADAKLRRDPFSVVSEFVEQKDRETAAKAFRDRIDQTVDGTQKKIALLQADREKLVRALSEPIEPSARAQKTIELSGLDVQIKSLQAKFDIIKRTAEGIRSSRALLQEQEAKLIQTDPTRSEEDRGRAALEIEKRRIIEQRTSSVNARTGEIENFKLSRQELENIEKTFNLKRIELEREVWKKKLEIALEDGERAIENTLEQERRGARERENILAESDRIANDARRRAEDFSIAQLEPQKEAALRQLELVSAITVQQKVALENRKFQIEGDFLEKSTARQIDVLKRRAELEIQQEQSKVDDQSARDTIRFDREKRLNEQIEELSTNKNNRLAEASDTAAIRTTQIVRDHNQQVFDGLQHSVLNMLEAVENRTKGLGATIADLLKRSFFSAFNQILSAGITRTILQLFNPGSGGGQASGGGVLGSLRGLLNLGGVGALGLGGNAAGLIGPGGTSGFAGPIQSIPGLVGIGTTAGGGFGIHGVGSIPGLGGGAGVGFGGAAGLGTLGVGGAALGLLGAFKAGQSGNSVLRGASPAIGAAAGLFGFGALSSLFPALIGAGPIGWIAAAGIGAAFGIIGLLKGNAESKIIERVKSIYGIDIPRNFAKDPLAGIIKQNFGGNIDVGLRSPQVRDLIELYAMSTGQNSSGINPRMVGLSYSLGGGGSFAQAPVYQNGIQIPIDQIPRGTPSTGTTGTTVIQLDSEATLAFLQGQAIETIQGNPRVVSSAISTASRQNAGRLENYAIGVNPLLLIS